MTMRPALRSAQRGAAVLMALFVSVLATVIVSGLFWNQFVLIRTIENQQLVTQSRLLLDGALDWARAMLREDLLRSSYDALDGFWAQGLEETRLDQLGETSTLAAQASMAGNIEDAQARMNLRNLLRPDGTIDPLEQAALERLCTLLGLPRAAAELAAEQMRQAWLRNAEDGSYSGRRELPPWQPGDLAAIKGISREAAEKLAAYVVVLDVATPVNVNTARAEVIAAQIKGMSLAQARAIVNTRDRIGHFTNLGDFLNNVPDDLKAGAGDRVVATQSRYFFVRGQVKLARADIRFEALVRRPPGRNQGPVEVLWQREL
jgi:general secretion pathway protein K